MAEEGAIRLRDRPARAVRGPRPGLLLLVFLTAWAGLPHPAAAQEDGDALQGAPEWVRTRTVPDYPSSRYVLGFGVARARGSDDALAEAVGQSRAALAQQIRTELRQTVRHRVVERRGPGRAGVVDSMIRRTREVTELELQAAEVVRQWVGPRNVYVLSALDRRAATRRARSRIERLEAGLKASLEELERLAETDPLEGVLRLGRLSASRDSLSLQYALLAGVTREPALPPPWTDRVGELGRRLRSGLRVAVLVDPGTGGEARGRSYSALRDLVAELGWSAQSLPRRAPGRIEALDRAGVRSRLRESGVRYLLAVRTDAKVTETVEVGRVRQYYARAGGRWELHDLADDEIVLQASYTFPAETKALGRRKRQALERARRQLMELMREELVGRLGAQEPAADVPVGGPGP